MTNERPKPAIREPERKPPMKDPSKRKGPLGDPSGDQPVRRDPIPKRPDGDAKEIRDPKVPGRPDEIKTHAAAWRRPVPGVLVLGSVVVLVLACERRPESETHSERATLTSAALASPMARDAVVTQIAHEHCRREARCGHVGPMRRFGDHEACLRRFVPETRESLADAECHAGVAAAPFDACLRALRAEPCDDLMADIVRLSACGARDLCARQE